MSYPFPMCFECHVSISPHLDGEPFRLYNDGDLVFFSPEEMLGVKTDGSDVNPPCHTDESCVSMTYVRLVPYGTCEGLTNLSSLSAWGSIQ